jgi:hypothetical protein
MPSPPVSNLALGRIVRDLEKLKSDAEKADLPMLVHLLDVALLEARAQATNDA